MGHPFSQDKAADSLLAGTVVGKRFVIERAAGTGGTATVYRAKDTVTGQVVALKLLHAVVPKSPTATRLLIESQLLSELRHPRIVSYIAHGTTADGQPYLAMEWLSGESLGERLQRAPLSLHETLTLLDGVTDALAAAHARGIIHRDIKPSNLFLRDGQVEQVTLLDFGVARQKERGLALTRTGALIGTPGYMAPEQAKGERDITPSADIFSLGCVIYECLTGSPPFVAMHFAALLARILYDEVPSVHSLRPEVPGPLSRLIDHMLYKQPSRRPADAVVLQSALHGLSLSIERSAGIPVTQATPGRFRSSERQLVCVVIASQRPPRILTRETLDWTPPSVGYVASLQELASLLYQAGAVVETLAEDTLIASFPIEASAVEQLTRIVGCAQQALDLWPQGVVIVAVTQTDQEIPALVGKDLTQVSALLDDFSVHQSASELDPQNMAGIYLDESVGSLVDSIFETEPVLPHFVRLHGERHSEPHYRQKSLSSARLLGRAGELGVLSATLRRCEQESEARALIVLGRSGMGKTRLLSAFLSEASFRYPNLTMLHGTATPIPSTQLAPLLRSALRRMCGITVRETGSSAKRKLLDRLKQTLSAQDVQRCLEPLSLLCEVPLSDRAAELSGEYRKLSSEQALCDAWLRFLSAACEQGPVLIALDDLQWADASSLWFFEQALTRLSDRPLLVIGLARSSLSQHIAALFPSLHVDEVRIDALPRLASEQLVRELAQGQLPESRYEEILRLGQGHPLHLQELTASALLGREEGPSPSLTVRIQVEALGLPKEARRLLRAASIFGPVFWDEGVRAILGESVSMESIAQWLRLLVEKEWLIAHRESRFPGTQEFGFRQLIVHACFVAMCHPTERSIAQELAASFLSRSTAQP
jgi:serine/threonine protein kinase